VAADYQDDDGEGEGAGGVTDGLRRAGGAVPRHDDGGGPVPHRPLHHSVRNTFLTIYKNK